MTDDEKPVYAFPLPTEQCVRGYESTQSAEPGMELRDYFAATAIGPLLAAIAAQTHELHQDLAPVEVREWVARTAYEYADAMLVARK